MSSNLNDLAKLYSDLKATKKVLINTKSYEAADVISTHIKISAEKIADEVEHEHHLISHIDNVIDEEVAAEVTSRDIEDEDTHYLSLEKDKFIDNNIKQQKEERAINNGWQNKEHGKSNIRRS
jgi:hypothetical protein